MILRAQLADVVRNVNTWNAAYNLGLTYHGSQHSAAAWGVGNCLFTVRAVDVMTTEWQLVRFKLQPADSQVRSVWGKIGELFSQVGWIPFFESNFVDPIFGGFDHLTTEEEQLPAETAWKEAHRQKHLEEATVRSQLIKATLYAVGMPAHVKSADELLPDIETNAWTTFLQDVEHRNVEARLRAVVADKATEEAVAEFFASLATDTLLLHQSLQQPETQPQPVTDPTDQRILDLVRKDPDLRDADIGRQLNLSRQAVNKRRRQLQRMGYKVR
jgi:hypothetical protein